MVFKYCGTELFPPTSNRVREEIGILLRCVPSPGKIQKTIKTGINILKIWFYLNKRQVKGNKKVHPLQIKPYLLYFLQTQNSKEKSALTLTTTSSNKKDYKEISKRVFLYSVMA